MSSLLSGSDLKRVREVEQGNCSFLCTSHAAARARFLWASPYAYFWQQGGCDGDAPRKALSTCLAPSRLRVRILISANRGGCNLIMRATPLLKVQGQKQAELRRSKAVSYPKVEHSPPILVSFRPGRRFGPTISPALTTYHFYFDNHPLTYLGSLFIHIRLQNAEFKHQSRPNSLEADPRNFIHDSMLRLCFALYLGKIWLYCVCVV